MLKICTLAVVVAFFVDKAMTVPLKSSREFNSYNKQLKGVMIYEV